MHGSRSYTADQLGMIIKEGRVPEKILAGMDHQEFYSCLNEVWNPLSQRLMRRAIGIILEKVPYGLRLFITGWLKRVRNPRRSLPIPEILHFKFSRLTADEKKPEILYPGNKKYYIGITHDVDNRQGWVHLEELLGKTEQHQLRSTVNVLTQGNYRVSRSELEGMTRRGFEIGLHGDLHDIGIAFRGYRKIRNRLKRAVESLGFLPRGFRSPALSISYDLLEALQETGFQYDSSFQTGSLLYKSTEYPYIYRFRHYRLFEAPLFLQDDYFFREAALSEKEALLKFTSLIRQMKEHSGAAVINIHPHLVHDKEYFLTGLLDFIAQEDDACREPLYKVIQFYQNRQEVV